MTWCLLLAASLALCGSSGLLAESVGLEYVDGIADLTGSCFLEATRLSSKPRDGLSEPTYRGRPLYGTIPLAEEAFPVVLDVQTNGATLYAGLDSSGALVEVPWEGRLWDGRYLASALFGLSYGRERRSPYRAFLFFDPDLPSRLAYCRDSRREGDVVLGDAAYRVAVVDEDTDGDYGDLAEGTLYVDLDQDGVLLATSDSHERYRLDEPFNVHGTVYQVTRLTRDGAEIEIGPSGQWVEERLPLEPGHPAPVFTAQTTGGEEISLSSLRGRAVLLDFWASWCAPCIEEFPALAAIAAESAGSELVILGINLDRDEEAFAQALDFYGLPYSQVYDGPAGPIASLYRVSAIPMVYLIDPEGTIRAKGLRGVDLLQAVRELVKE